MRIKCNSECEPLLSHTHGMCPINVNHRFHRPFSSPTSICSQSPDLLILAPLASSPSYRPALTISLLDSFSSFISHPTYPSSAPPLRDPICPHHKARPTNASSQTVVQVPRVVLREPVYLCSLCPPVPFCCLLSNYTQLPASLHSGPEVLPPSSTI